LCVFCVMNSYCNIINNNINGITCISRTINCCGCCGDCYCWEHVSLGRQDSRCRALCRRSCCQRHSGCGGYYTGKHGANWTRREFLQCMVFYWIVDRVNAHDLFSPEWPNTFHNVGPTILYLLSQFWQIMVSWFSCTVFMSHEYKTCTTKLFYNKHWNRWTF
jgi:hypothetical protein